MKNFKSWSRLDILWTAFSLAVITCVCIITWDSDPVDKGDVGRQEDEQVEDGIAQHIPVQVAKPHRDLDQHGCCDIDPDLAFGYEDDVQLIPAPKTRRSGAAQISRLCADAETGQIIRKEMIK